MAAFTWDQGDDIRSRRRLAEALMKEGMDYSPVRSWTQGLARVANALVGGAMMNSEDQADRDALKLRMNAPGLGGPDMVATTPSAGTVSPSPMPAIGADTPLQDAINKVAVAHGVDPAYLTNVASIESGGNVNATTPLSSAKGPFQFVNSTAKQYGLTNPTDAYASADVAARLTLDNKAALTQALGREPTQGELYLAHQQGAGGAAKLLANPDAPATSIVGHQAVINNGGSPMETASQFAQRWTSRFPQGQPTADSNIVPIGTTEAPAVSPNVQRVTQAVLAQPGQPASTPAAPMRSPVQIPPQMQGYIKSLLSNPRTADAGWKLYQQWSAPKDQWSQQSGPDGTIYQRNALTGQMAVVDHGDKKPPSVLEYEYYKRQVPAGQTAMPYDQWATAKARASAAQSSVNIDQRAESEFTKEAGKLQAKQFSDLVDDVGPAKQMISDIDTLRTLGAQIGTGKTAQVMGVLGPYAQAIGVDVKGLNEVQAYEAITNRLAPTLRVKGSGAQSDFELRNFMKSLPSIGNQPGGNELISQTLTGLYQNKLAASEIGSKALNGEMSKSDAQKALRELPDPMANYREFIKRTNPAAANAVKDLKAKYGLE